MPKLTEKLLVYLDQNFISEIAKRDFNAKVRPEFTDLYEILKTGFLEEKLVVPQSYFHNIETSLAPDLKEHIVRYQSYVGQISLYHECHVNNIQIGRSLQRFLGEDQDLLDIDIAFCDHPDQRVKQFNITVDSHLERRNLQTGRLRHAATLEALRQVIIEEGLSFPDQLEREFIDSACFYLQSAMWNYGHLATEQQLVDFGQSQAFRETPIVKISAELYASLLTERTRTIKEGDVTDVQILSTYLPYIDVFATDTFMATQIKTLGIDQEHQVTLYGARTDSVRSLIDYLSEYVRTMPRVNRPLVSVFVLPSADIKDQAFAFFKRLGNLAMGFREREYVELYGFDDGAMPQYEMRGIPGHPLQFYGLQDVDPIKLRTGSTHDDILRICRERCNSSHFVVIDRYQDIPDHFFHGILMEIDAEGGMAYGYEVYATEPT